MVGIALLRDTLRAEKAKRKKIMSKPLKRYILLTLTIASAIAALSGAIFLFAESNPRSLPETIGNRQITALLLFATLILMFGLFFFLRRRKKKIIDQLTDWQLLANGGMADVWVAYHNKLKQVIVKFPRTHNNKVYNEIVKYRFEIEIREHKKLHHRNIVPLIEHGFGQPARHIIPSSQATPYLIQPFIDGCTLDKLLDQQQNKRFSDRKIAEIATQILAALGYMHAQQVIHRDLSLKNIMLDKSGQVYLIDFGNSTSINSQNTEVRGLPSIGTAPFYAPQSIGNVPERDYYALGMLIYAMYGGKLIKGQDDKQVKKAIEEKLDHLTSVPEWRRVVLKRCWNGEYKDSATLSKALRLPEPNPPEINAPERQLRPDWHPYPC